MGGGTIIISYENKLLEASNYFGTVYVLQNYLTHFFPNFYSETKLCSVKKYIKYS